MKFISETICMKKPSHQHFRPGILALDLAHIITALLLCMHICHAAKLQTIFINYLSQPNSISLYLTA